MTGEAAAMSDGDVGGATAGVAEGPPAKSEQGETTPALEGDAAETANGDDPAAAAIEQLEDPEIAVSRVCTYP
jgi:hypothetical protein